MHRVTLVTGDVVTYAESTDGQRMFSVDPAPRPGQPAVGFHGEGGLDGFFVYPTDVLPYVASGALDRGLFNVAELVREGLDDSRSRTLPVLVTYRGTPTPRMVARDADALPSAKRTFTLSSLRGAALKVERSKAAAFWDALDVDKPNPRAGKLSLERNVARMWLDRKVRATLDHTVPQIGAPSAWQAGFDGGGVRVAVVDTGVDASHPDLSGKVVAAKNFTADPDASDGHGHGTHVASTIAGSGAASGGKYKGVAPGTTLLNAKVLDKNGSGTSSSVIAGMEWAVKTGGARVVNMSLGGGPTDGTDPLSQAVNDLTAETGALFVIAAGNNGPSTQTVGSPGAASGALTVGAVDKSNVLASFSSRGPRVGDFAVKPNITAPGVGVVAARAVGTTMGTPVDASYTTASGTSMATPHVAGAAALLAQAYSGWRATELRNALASTALDGGHAWFEQGAGRIDVTRAVTQKVYGTASVDFGDLTDTTSKTLTYTNNTASAVTLNLATSVSKRGDNQAASGVTLSASSLTVPANGQSSVTLTVDPAKAGSGVFGGIVTATASGVSLRTPVSFAGITGQSDLTVRLFDSAGSSAALARVVVINDSYDEANPVGEPDYARTTTTGTATFTVPAGGTYTVLANVIERGANGQIVRENLLTAVEVPVDEPSTVAVDARAAVLTRATAPQATAVGEHSLSLIRQYRWLPGASFSMLSMPGADQWPIYVKPAPAGKLAALSLMDFWSLVEPTTGVPAYLYNLPFWYDNGIPTSLARQVGVAQLVRWPARYHADRPDVRYRKVWFPQSPQPFAMGLRGTIWWGPTAATEHVLASDEISWAMRTEQLVKDPTGRWRGGTMPSLRGFYPTSQAGKFLPEERWFQSPQHLGALEPRPEQQVTTSPRWQPWLCAFCRGGKDELFFPGLWWQDTNQGHGAVVASYPGTVRMYNLSAGGKEIPDSGKVPIWPTFSLGANAATFKMVAEDNGPDPFAFRTAPRVSTTHTFTSKRSSGGTTGYTCPFGDYFGTDCKFQPLILLRYQLGLDLLNQAPAGGAFSFEIKAGAHVATPNPATVNSLTVSFSTDDGKRWTSAQVTSLGGGRFKVTVNHPALAATNGFAWLRTQARDSTGNSVDQTVQRAYILK